ncbi:MAG: DEAD/DEAH box helicase [Deltaproteobacteria bacterium]|nr:DEAD/DEAH box helicase [Deltaproteobacteria bacterium]
MRGQFHPLIADWFERKFGTPTEPQRLGWPHIAAGRDTLIAAPTGSGKTLAAFLACLDDLVRRDEAGRLEAGTHVLYVSPLKALGNDIQRNLERPLAELGAAAQATGAAAPRIEVAVRSGDTPVSERARMAKHPPHILITTPESLYILLTAERSRAALARVRTVIVDEIHAVLPDKRGAHLALSLERLDALVTGQGGARPVRIGLSATQRPIEEVGRFLVGAGRPLPAIIDVGHRRALDLAVEVPARTGDLGAVATHEMWDEVYDRLVELTRAHRTTIVFVNTRRLVERVAFHLGERLGEDKVAAHHGSLSRATRLAAEEKLKRAEVPVVVATASLELGIDVGEVDLVVQVGSPRSIATLLQRIGRSGHTRGGTPKGRLIALTRDQLVECAALVRAVRAGALDALRVREAPLDVLAQQVVAETAARTRPSPAEPDATSTSTSTSTEPPDGISEADMLALVRGAYPYAGLAEPEFGEIVTMLSEGISTSRGRRSALLHRDAIGQRLRARRGARLTAITSGGAIPDTAQYAVVAEPEGMTVGSLDEDFAIESNRGDIFLLGNTSWRIQRVEQGIVRVEDAHGAAPTIPFWVGEAPARTAELSAEVSALRTELDARLTLGDPLAEIAASVAEQASLLGSAAQQLVAYLAAGRAALGALPTATTLVAERFFDQAGGMQLVLHAPLGGRINRAWGLALRKRFCRSFDFELQAAATDDGIIISLGPTSSFPLADVFDFLRSHAVKALLEQAVLQAPVWGVRWRWNATRALAVQRWSRGRKVPPPLIRMRSDDLMTAVFPQAQACLENVVGDVELPDHVLVRETMRDCLTEALDLPGLQRLVGALERGELRLVARDTAEPSPLCHEIVNVSPYGFLDDAPLEERRTRAIQLRRTLPDAGGELGVLDAAAVRTVEDEARGAPRDADELHDHLLSVVLEPAPRSEWTGWFEALVAAGRAARVRWTAPEDAAGAASAHLGWVATERAAAVRAALPAALLEPDVQWLPPGGAPDAEAAVLAIVRGHVELSGPLTAAALAGRLGLGGDAVSLALVALESEGAVLRGAFTAPGAAEWCDRRMLARVQALTLGRLRREIEPVSAADHLQFLLRWQHLAPGTQVAGAPGVLAVVEQLAGFEVAAGAWEDEVLARRVLEYQPAWLDALCFSGEIAWGRRGLRDGEAGAPTRAAPIALMPRSELDWLLEPAEPEVLAERRGRLSAAAADALAHLERRGASFLPELAVATGRRASELEDALWELVAAGLVTADGFAALRALLHEHRSQRPATPGGVRGRLLMARAATRGLLDRAQPAPHATAGRWVTLSRSPSPSPSPSPSAESLAALAEQLLIRYGVVFRDLLAREPHLPPWRELSQIYRRLEQRGELRGGRFIAGFVGEQFALPEAVAGLRQTRRDSAGRDSFVRVSACDPCNLVGVTSPGPRVPATLGNAILFRNGVAIASREAGEIVLRRPLPPGARIDADLVYFPPPTSFGVGVDDELIGERPAPAMPTPLARTLAQRERLPPPSALAPPPEATSAGASMSASASLGAAADEGAGISALRETIARILALEGEAPG